MEKLHMHSRKLKRPPLAGFDSWKTFFDLIGLQPPPGGAEEPMSVRKFFLLGGSVAGWIRLSPSSPSSSSSSPPSVFRSLCSSTREERSPVDFASIALRDQISKTSSTGKRTKFVYQSYNHQHRHNIYLIDTWKQLSVVSF